MSRIVFCSKLKQELPGLDTAPFPGSVGQRIFEQVSQAGWDAWLRHQTMLINEYRLNLMEAKAKQFLRDEMEKFLFGEGSEAPSGYVPE